MSGHAEALAAGPPLERSDAGRPRSLFGKSLAWIGDRLNPILVKEARQALKSRQFVLTFALLLICGWGWSILGLALAGPEVAYGFKGAEMFTGYFVILAFPLLVIVPFGAFRSIASEQEDRTYELMSISALKPRQIVSGKLGSSLLQMLVYLSAISPCIAFTYMLGGVAAPLLIVALCTLFLASLGLSAIGLLVGTLTSEKHWQVVLSVGMVAVLLVCFWISLAFAISAIYVTEVPVNEPEFWQVVAVCLTAYVTYFALVFFAAVARVTFASDNRSTKLRVVMAVQHLALIAWMAFGLGTIDPTIFGYELFVMLFTLMGIHWGLMGALMIGESPELSMRVKRRLPQSFLGRVFLTWFNPGPGTGYLFAVCGSLAALALAVPMMFYVNPIQLPYGQFNLTLLLGEIVRIFADSQVMGALAFGTLVVGYLTFYLGAALLLIRLARRFLGPVSLFLALLVGVLLVLLGCLGPMVIEMSSATRRYSGYTMLQTWNPFYTLAEIADGSFRAMPPELPWLLIVVPGAAAIVFLLNLPAIAREVRHVRIAKPTRVAEEDAAREAERHPPASTRISPWDE